MHSNRNESLVLKLRPGDGSAVLGLMVLWMHCSIRPVATVFFSVLEKFDIPQPVPLLMNSLLTATLPLRSFLMMLKVDG